MNKTPQTELAELVRKTLLPQLPGLTLGPLPSGEGAAVQITGGAREDVYLDRSETRYLTLLLLCKAKKHAQAFDLVCQAANTLRHISPLPQPTGCQWVKCEIETDPQEVGIVNSMYIYSCVIRAYYYLK